MTDTLTTDDPLYEQLYDVRREAMEVGNFVEGDINPTISALRNRGAVQKGYLRELLGLPEHKRHAMAKGREGYSVLSFAACEMAFRDPQRFSSKIVHHPSETEEQTMGILEMDGAQHLAYRQTMQTLFIKPQTVTWWRERWINDIIDKLIERLKRQDRAELNLDYCARVPVHTVTRAIGMEGDESLVFRDALLKSSEARGLSPTERQVASDTVWRMLHELIAKRRVEPGDDIVSKLIEATLRLPDGTQRLLTDREIAINCRLVILAGGGTSWRQFGITLWALLTNADQLADVKANRSLIDQAIEESVRWNVTAPVFSRLVVEDAELAGVCIPAGSVVDLCTGAANRDPNRWENADQFNLHRKSKPHLGFGLGPHSCLGANAARSEIGAGLNALLDAFPNIRLDPDQPAPYLTGGLEQRGMSAIPVMLR